MSVVNRYVLFLVPLLASCGGGGSGGGQPLSDPLTDVFNPAATVVNACSSEHYTELVGDYDGQIAYDDGDELSCFWEVELQVSSGYTSDPNTRSICDLTFNMASTGASAGCSDIGIGGKLLDTLSVSRESWTNTSYPVDAFAQVPSAIPDNGVFPIGIAGQAVSQFTVTFDGRGNVTFPNSVSAEPEYTGVLVKQ